MTIAHRLSFLIAAAALLGAQAASAEAAVLAVVVDKSNPRTDVTVDELRALFLGRQRDWSDGTRAVPLDLPAQTAERDLFNSAVLGMDQGTLDRHWVDERVRGTGSTQPRVAPIPGAVLKLAGKIRGVVGYVPLSAVDGSVKVLKVAGILPGKPGYALQGN